MLSVVSSCNTELLTSVVAFMIFDTFAIVICETGKTVVRTNADNINLAENSIH